MKAKTAEAAREYDPKIKRKPRQGRRGVAQLCDWLFNRVFQPLRSPGNERWSM